MYIYTEYHRNNIKKAFIVKARGEHPTIEKFHSIQRRKQLSSSNSNSFWITLQDVKNHYPHVKIYK